MGADQQWDITSGVGVTALAVAAGRAVESARDDALITDPYAAAFVAAAGTSAPLPVGAGEPHGQGDDAHELWSLVVDYVGIRSRVFDDFLTDAARDGIRQIVILASGLDTRAFRLEWPAGTRCFELDQPGVLDFKLRVLSEHDARPSCLHTPVPTDLREDWAAALEGAGFTPEEPTAWLAEGLLPYLTPEAEERLFKEIDRLSAPGSRLAAEHTATPKAIRDDALLRQSSTAFGIDVPALLPEETKRPLSAQLTALGWEHRQTPPQESAAALGRALPSHITDKMLHTFARHP
ncbi:methyltransferase [Streptomyces sp. NRRL F-6602]|nr:methyltransferase [Streptomyces sp. NRRL F-6602]